MKDSRRASPADPGEYGFGTKVMKTIKVCGSCGNTEAAERYTCSKCGKRLPVQTLFQIYQKKHRVCSVCDTVLAAYMRYCPHCGTQIEPGIHDEAL